MSTNIPLIGPPDGWPRTADGHLIKIGSTPYYYDGCEFNVITICRDGMAKCHNITYDSQCFVRFDCLHAIKPKPKTWLDKQIEHTEDNILHLIS